MQYSQNVIHQQVLNQFTTQPQVQRFNETFDFFQTQQFDDIQTMACPEVQQINYNQIITFLPFNFSLMNNQFFVPDPLMFFESNLKVNKLQRNLLYFNKKEQKQISTKKQNQIKKALNFYKQKKYFEFLKILSKLQNIDRNLQVLKQITICFVKLNDFNSAIKFAKYIKYVNNKIDYSSKLQGYVYIQKAIQQNKICLAKKSIYYFSYAFNKKKSFQNRQNLEKALLVKYTMSNQKQTDKKNRFLKYLEKFQFSDAKLIFIKTQNQDIKIPDYLKCIISIDILNLPYLTPSGASYEKKLLFKLFSKQLKIFDPLSRKSIFKQDCIFNKSLQAIIIQFKKQHPIFQIESINKKEIDINNLDFTI